MTEYRALTQGGCFPGSYTWADTSRGNYQWTCPAAVTRVLVGGTDINGNKNYIACTPGRTYNVRFIPPETRIRLYRYGDDSAWLHIYTNNQTLEWSNEINTHAAVADWDTLG